MLDIFQEIFEVVGSKLTGGKCNLFTNKKVISLFFFIFFGCINFKGVGFFFVKILS